MPDPKVDFTSWSARKIAAYLVSVTLKDDLTAVIICKGGRAEVYGNDTVVEFIRELDNHMPIGGGKFYGRFSSISCKKWESLSKDAVLNAGKGKRLSGKSFGVKGAVAAFGLPE